MYGHDLTPYRLTLHDARPYWDLYVSANLVLLAYHCCGAMQKPVPARYNHEKREYACPSCGARHTTYIGETDRLLSAVSDSGYYAGRND